MQNNPEIMHTDGQSHVNQDSALYGEVRDHNQIQIQTDDVDKTPTKNFAGPSDTFAM